MRKKETLQCSAAQQRAVLNNCTGIESLSSEQKGRWYLGPEALPAEAKAEPNPSQASAWASSCLRARWDASDWRSGWPSPRSRSSSWPDRFCPGTFASLQTDSHSKRPLHKKRAGRQQGGVVSSEQPYLSRLNRAKLTRRGAVQAHKPDDKHLVHGDNN